MLTREYVGLRRSGFTPEEASNLVAIAHGVPHVPGGWTLAQLAGAVKLLKRC